MSYKEVNLIDNHKEKAYELWIEEKRSFIDYKIEGGSSLLLHTEVPEELEGQGIGSSLVEKTLSYLQEENLKVVPICSFVKTYLQTHPEWNHLVANSK